VRPEDCECSWPSPRQSSKSPAGASFIALLISFILFEAACLFGLLAVHRSWLGLAALVGAGFNAWMYYATIGEFIELLGSG
jgi:hypothetical protein